MKKATAITCLFLDIGGVLLTDGWDHHARKRAATSIAWSATKRANCMLTETKDTKDMLC